MCEFPLRLFASVCTNDCSDVPEPLSPSELNRAWKSVCSVDVCEDEDEEEESLLVSEVSDPALEPVVLPDPSCWASAFSAPPISP